MELWGCLWMSWSGNCAEVTGSLWQHVNAGSVKWDPMRVSHAHDHMDVCWRRTTGLHLCMREGKQSSAASKYVPTMVRDGIPLPASYLSISALLASCELRHICLPGPDPSRIEGCAQL